MSIANQLQAARTTFETLVEKLEPSGSGLASLFAYRKGGEGGQAIEFDMAGAAPGWRRWVGPKQFEGLREMSVTCPFDKYYKPLKLKRKDVVNDKTGTVGQRMADFLGPHDYLYDKLVVEKLAANPTCIDGARLISDAHPYGESGGTWDNKVTTALSHEAFRVGRAFGRSLKSEKGEPLEIDYDTLLVHPDEERTAIEIAQADTRPVSVATSGAINGAAGATSIANVYKGIVNVVVSPRFTSGDWMLMDSKRGKPIGLGVWRDPEAHITDDMSGEHRQIFDEFLYAVESDVNTCGLLPYGVYGKNSAA